MLKTVVLLNIFVETVINVQDSFESSTSLKQKYFVTSMHCYENCPAPIYWLTNLHPNCISFLRA